MKRIFIPFLALSLIHCVNIDLDEDETGPVVEFDPATSVIPIPNSLLFDPEGTGLLQIPEGCNETATESALRVGVLNQLDGFGTFKPAAQVTLTSPVDPASATGLVKMFQRTNDGTGIDPLVATEVPITIIPGTTDRDSADCSSSSEVDNFTIVPLVPLQGNSIYTVVVLAGLEDENGDAYLPSSTWAFVRQETNPVVIEDGAIVSENTPLNPANAAEREQILGISLLWNAHAAALGFLDDAVDVSRNDILLAWDFKTQTISEPLDRAVSGSPANSLPTDGFFGYLDLMGMPQPGLLAVDGGDPEAFINGNVTPGCTSGVNCFCDLVPTCAAVGNIKVGGYSAPNYQIDTPNPLGTTATPVPGPWPTPLSPTQNGAANVSVLAITPVTAPAGEGWPVVIFGHGITRSKGDLLAIGSQLAAIGVATISMDWVAHGSPDPSVGGRAVQIDDTSPQCMGTPDPTDRVTGGITCFSPFLTSDMAGNRDNVRQSALDAMGLVNALKACDTDAIGSVACDPTFDIDSTKIGYLGQSLGSIIGTLVVAQSPDIQAAVLNVGGVGLVDVIENTASASLQCPLVDALIAAGVIEGIPWDSGANMDATCLGDAWKTDPAWLSFANVARWILDPGDGANYTGGLLGRPVLIQEVVNDGTVPNIATSTQAALMGLIPATSAEAGGMVPTTGIDGATAVHVQYPSTATHVYDHGSLLAPAAATMAAQAGTAQMQADAVFHLCVGLYGAGCPLLP